MAIFEENKIQARDIRNSTITAYFGKVDKLISDSANERIRTFSQSTFDEVIYSLKVLADIEESVVIIHGPVGCGIANISFIDKGIKWYTTNLEEVESIFGGDSRLESTVIEAYKKHNPKIIFILSTAVVAINNDDIISVSNQLEEELDIKIIPIFTDGFKSKSANNGYDLVLHSIGKYLIPADYIDIKKENFVNLISLSETNKEIKEIISLIKELELDINIFPRFSKFDDFKKIGSASVTVTLNDEEGGYLAEGMEKELKVPYLKTNVPIGFVNTSIYIEEIAKFFGIEDKAKRIISKESTAYKELIKILPLTGIKIYVDLEVSKALSLVSLIRELGGQVVGVTVTEIDGNNVKNLEELNTDINIHIANGQLFETANILNKLKPDIYISSNNKSSWVCKYNVIPLSIDKINIYGFNGPHRLVNSVEKAINNKGIYQNLYKDFNSDYKESWLKKSSNWYIKLEVK